MSTFTAVPAGKLTHSVAVRFLETRRAELEAAAAAVDKLATDALLSGDLDTVHRLLDQHGWYMHEVARIDACRAA